MPTPSHRIPVTTYEDLCRFARDFATGAYPLLIIVGGPGLAKSRTIRSAMGNRPHLQLDGHVTPLAMFELLYQHIDEPVVIDDVDGMYANESAVRILKPLCNTELVKTMRWNSTSSRIGNGADQTPPEFTTSSRVCLIANVWRSLNANVAALEDRAICLDFRPSAAEVHVKAREWFDDLEVYHFIEENLLLIPQPSMRHYVKGRQLRQANAEQWRQHLLAIIGIDEKTRQMVEIINAPGYTSEAERIEAFQARGLGDRSTYFRRKQKLLRGTSEAIGTQRPAAD